VIKFLAEKRYFVTSKDERQLTHTLMDGARGGRIVLPADAAEEFFSAYGHDLAVGNALYVVERRSDIFKMHFDIDMTGEWSDESLMAIARVVHKATMSYFSMSAGKMSWCVVCACLQDKGIRISSGLHIIFPFLAVNEEQALWIRGGVVAACTDELSAMDLDFNKVVDICVLTTNGLRMVGSDKCKTCPDCRNGFDSKPFCDTCARNGKVAENRIYMPWKTLPLLETESLQCDLKSNLAFAAKLCSTRLPDHTSLCPHFAIPSGAPPCSVKKKKKEGFQLTDGHSDLPSIYGKWTVSDIEVGLKDLLRSELRSYHPVFSRIDIKELRKSTNVKGPPTYIVKVQGYGCRSCLNKGSDHTSQGIYFLISQFGLCQKCFSRKSEERRYGLCEKFASETKPIQTELKEALFDGTVVLQRVPSRIMTASQRIDSIAISKIDENLTYIPPPMKRSRHIPSTFS
jgi:hypothetical protein